MNDGAGSCSNRSTVGATSTISTFPSLREYGRDCEGGGAHQATTLR